MIRLLYLLLWETQIHQDQRETSEMDPDSPVSNFGLREVLSEFFAPMKEELSSINEFMVTASKKLDSIGELQEQVIGLKRENELIKGKMNELQSKVDHLTNSQKSDQSKLAELRSENEEMRENLLRSECQSRRDNLVFLGVHEEKGQSCEESVLGLLNYAGFPLDMRSIVRAHRLGPFAHHKTRPVIVRFHNYQDRETVWIGKKFIKDSCDVTVVEDFPEEIRNRRKQLYPVLNASLSYHDVQFPDYRFKARLTVDKLIINGKSYTVDTLDKLPDKIKPALSSSPSKGETQVFFSKSSPLSNFYQCNFKVDGVEYNTMEQYLQQAKALYFNDNSTAEQIMATSDPVKQKQLGKTVLNFDFSTWQGAVPDILMKGLRAKFGQVDHCKDFLTSTEGKTLGEANGWDKFFGIGMSLQHPKVWQKELWGRNLLGESLMEVRDTL